MTNTKNKRGGFYWVDGTPYASVTDIISVLDKPALRYWFGKTVYRAFAANPDLSENEALVAPWQLNGDAKDRGSTVHSIVESWKQTKKNIATIPDQFKGYADAFYKFVKTNHVEIKEHEKTVVSRLYRFAGTLDILAKINGNKKLMIIDVKTGKGLYPEVELQLSAYRQALKEEGVEADIAALLLGEDGTYQFAKYEKDRLEQFLACLTIWRWQNEEKLAQMNFFKGGK
jgi:23S rRNA pseudoU1915 N3-methylase RlmH